MSVGAAEGFHSFQLSKRNLFIENFLSQKSAQKKNSHGPAMANLCKLPDMSVLSGIDRGIDSSYWYMNADFGEMNELTHISYNLVIRVYENIIAYTILAGCPIVVLELQTRLRI